MTDKQESIVMAALQLFAKDGYNATSTSKIAKKAEVSEGLIFRHFENKEGLLKAILELGTERVKKYFADIVLENDPQSVIRKTLELPFTIVEEEHEFWRLQFKLKWEIEHYDESKMDPLKMALTNAFKKLNYNQPELEAEIVVVIMEAISSSILKGTLKSSAEILKLLKLKYQV